MGCHKALSDEVSTDKNLIPAMVEAIKAIGMTDELLGALREVFGYPYDPSGVIELPFG